MKPEKYLELSRAIYEAIGWIEELSIQLRKMAEGFPAPASVRPATPSDIVEGNVIWYIGEDSTETHWQVVDEVLSPRDEFKAYLCDGTRYGLHGAFVEDKDANPTT